MLGVQTMAFVFLAVFALFPFQGLGSDETTIMETQREWKLENGMQPPGPTWRSIVLITYLLTVVISQIQVP